MCQCGLQEECIDCDGKEDEVTSVVQKLSALYGTDVGIECIKTLAKVFIRH